MAENGIRGLRHFVDYVAAHSGDYVIISGVAAVFSLDDAGLDSRPTKDIDLVVFANPNRASADRLREHDGKRLFKALADEPA